MTAGEKKKPNAPEFLLGLLESCGPMSGRDLRDRLNEGKWFWQRYTGGGFRRLMSLLEDAGLVEGWDVPKAALEGEVISERWYRSLRLGRGHDDEEVLP